MSAAPVSELYARFLKEFRQVARGVRRSRIVITLGLAAVLAACGLGLFAAADTLLVLPREVRQGLLVLGGVGLLLWFIARRRDQRWTAVERGTVTDIETAFPELGQRVRTAVQFGSLKGEAVSRLGVAPSLLDAMRSELDRQSSPLDLARVLSHRKTVGAVLAGILLMVGLWGSTFLEWRWNMAVNRALGGTTRYTTLALHTADCVVEERATVGLEFAVTGQCPPAVFIQSRSVNQPDAEWRERELRAESGRLVPAANRWSPPTRVFTASLGAVTEPIVWRVRVGEEISPTHRVGVRYPLAYKSIRVEVSPPEYTRLPSRTFDDGTITALVGSEARFTIQLDNPPQSVVLHSEPVLARGTEAPEWKSPEVHVDGTKIVFQTRLTEGFDWWLEAVGNEGVRLPRRDFRVRTQSDDPPRIVFEFPGERYDVHPLAEIPIRFKVTDDYGLARSGLVFQINNEEEHTLVEQEFPVEPTGADGILALPRTRVILERLLPLEELALSQRDCIAYYAWAEDNRPDSPQRIETELRYIDLRPFRQIYLLPNDPMNGGGGGDMNFTFGRRLSLDEILERQRTILNRTMGLMKRMETSDRELNTIDRLTVAQNRLASATRELATFFTAEEFDGADMLFQAEAAMLSAIDSISVATYDRAVLQERDAQQFLVEARNRIRLALQDPRNSSRLPRVRQFERQLSQKLRRPKRDNEQTETVQTLITALRKLSDDQRMSANQLASLGKPEEAKSPPPAADGATQKAPSTESPPPDASATPTPAEKPVPTPATPPAEGAAANPEAPSATAESEAPAAKVKSIAEQREEIIDRLADALADARQIETAIDREATMTALAKARIKAAVAKMEQATKQLESQAAPEQAVRPADESADALAELAVQLSAQSKEELAEQLASARDLASYLADEQRASLTSGQPPEGSPETKTSPEGADDVRVKRKRDRAASQLTEQAKTLEDVLANLARSDTPEGGDTIDKVAALTKSPDVAGLVAGFERQQREIESKPASNHQEELSPEDSRERLELAEASERTAMTLERLYRSIVMPRIEVLRTMQASAVRLETAAAASSSKNEQTGKGDSVETEMSSGWNREVDELLEQAEAVGAGAGNAAASLASGTSQQNERSREMNNRQGSSVRSPTLSSGRRRALRLLIEQLEQRIQETILADVEQLGTEATPPQYEPHVEQYLKVLARDRNGMKPDR